MKNDEKSAFLGIDFGHRFLIVFLTENEQKQLPKANYAETLMGSLFTTFLEHRFFDVF